MRSTFYYVLGLALLVQVTSAARSEVLQATPYTLSRILVRANGGDELILRPGNYGTIIIANRSFDKHLRVDASLAHFSAVTVRQVNGLDWIGGRLIGPRMQNLAFMVDLSKNINVANLIVSGPRIGLTISRSQHVQALNNVFDGVRSDGVNIAMSQYVNVIGNACLNFRPIRPVYASDGTLLVDGDHPDCIQAWSRSDFPPTAHVIIENNAAEGEMQGIWFGDPGRGGYDDVKIRSNNLTLRYWHGIAV
jgi:nitrous oxidase accessory protein NosD